MHYMHRKLALDLRRFMLTAFLNRAMEQSARAAKGVSSRGLLHDK